MRPRIMLLLLILVAVVAGLAFAQTKKALTNDDILQMVKAEFQESMIIKTIEANDANFDVSVQALMDLKNAGVSQPVIEAMLTAEARKRVPPSASVPAKDPAVESAAPADSSMTKLLLKEETEIALKFATDLPANVNPVLGEERSHVDAEQRIAALCFAESDHVFPFFCVGVLLRFRPRTAGSKVQPARVRRPSKDVDLLVTECHGEGLAPG